jgi:hypothetical protein
MEWDYFKQRKLTEHGKPDYFSFKAWEIDFMVEIIRVNYPTIKSVEILNQIDEELSGLSGPVKSVALYEKLVNQLNQPN